MDQSNSSFEIDRETILQMCVSKIYAIIEMNLYVWVSITNIVQRSAKKYANLTK